jgi:hypothetical protein
MITDIAGAIVAHQMRSEAAHRGIRKTSANRTHTKDARAGAGLRN